MDAKETEKKIEEIDTSVLNIVHTLANLIDQVKKTNEDVELSSRLMGTLQEYLNTVVKNFRLLERLLEKERILKARWKSAALTFLFGYVIIMATLFLSIYATVR